MKNPRKNHRLPAVTAVFIAQLLLTATASAQTLTGQILDQQNQPISDALVSVKDGASTTTNADGFFTLTCLADDIIHVDHPNYLTKERRVGKLVSEGWVIHLLGRFVDTDSDLTGPFGETIEREDFLGSSSTVKGKDLEKYLSTDILTALQGRMAGFNLSQYRGSHLANLNSNSEGALIGSIPSGFGAGSYGDNTRFNYASRSMSPVIIIDGVERNLVAIDPEAIESITLERDALSSMFLGMKSSRGALIITTKKPTEGKLHLSLTGKFGIHGSVQHLKPLSASQYAYLLNEALQNDGKSGEYTYDDYQKYLHGSDPFSHPNIYWEDEVMKSYSTTQSYNLGVAGGNKVAQYVVNLGYMNEAGLFKTNSANGYNTNLDYNRYMISSKVNINVTDNLIASLSAIGRIIEGNQPGGSGSGYSDLLLTIFQTPNNAYPIRNENGSFGGNYTFQNNLVSQTMESGYIADNTRDIMATGTLRYDFKKIIKGLTAKFTGNVTSQTRTAIIRTKRNAVYQYTKNDEGNPAYIQYGSPSPQTNSFTSVSNYHNLYGQLSFDYFRDFGPHRVAAMVMGDTRHEIDDYDLPMIPSNIMEGVGYSFAKKYFIQAKLTESYFNRYAPGNRWGTFGAVGLGWDISKEPFMEGATDVDRLKLYGTGGRTGNGVDNSGYYIWRQTYSTNLTALYPLGSERSNGYWVTEDGLANPYISYEKANKMNFGLDMAFARNRLNANIEFYYDTYLDLLQQRGKSIAILGIDYPYENIGRTRRWGWDVTMSWQDHIGTLNYYVNGNWSLTHTKLLFMDEQETPYNYLRQTGRPEGVIFGLQADGFLSAADIANDYPVMVGYNVQPGDVKYIDQNNDGVINEWDRIVIGGDKPVQFFGVDLGLEWKGLEFSMLWQGIAGRDLYVNNRTLVEGFQSIGNSYGQAYQNILARWTPETADVAIYPRLSAGGNTYNYGGSYGSSLWMHNGNFIRLKNMSLAYNLPETFCQDKLGDLRVKIFVEGQNLLTFSACDLVDPEVTFTSSPLQRAMWTGVKLNF